MIATTDQSTLCALATASFICYLLIKKSLKKKNDIDPHIIKCPLTEQEEKNKVMEASISTITWFEGDFDSTVNAMKKRVEEMVELNPWLLGKLKKEQGKVHLVFDYEESTGCVDCIFQTHYSQKLHLGVNISEAISVASKEQITVKAAKDLINKDEPIFKVTFISNPNEQRNIFGMIVSLSHRVGDGYTFYNLYKMLDPRKDLKSLNPYRKSKVIERIETKLGKKMLEGIGGVWVTLLFVKSVLLSKLRGERWEQKSLLVNPSFIEDMKNNTDLQEVDFITTNDIITSTCFKLAKTDMGMMPINFRGRVEDCGDLDAPNYMNTIMYRPADYDRPELIQKSLQLKVMKRASNPPTKEIPNDPTCLLKSINVTICTNWTSFLKNDFSLGSKSKQLLHMPLKDMRYAAPSLISNVTIYKPISNLTALLITGTPEMVKRFEQHPMVQLSEKSPGLKELHEEAARQFTNI